MKNNLKDNRLIISCTKEFHDQILVDIESVTHGKNNFSNFARMALLHEIKRIKKDLE